MIEAPHNIHINEAERYVQINEPDDDRLEAIIQNLGILYPGFTVDICYHNQPHPVEIIERLAAEMLDDAIELRLSRDNFVPASPDGITSQDSDLAELIPFHDARYPDMYWNGARLSRHRNDWDIAVNRANGQINGYALARKAPQTYDIYCVYAESADDARRLLSYTASAAFEAGAQEMLRMAERHNKDELAAASELGFVEQGYYRMFRMVLQ